MSNEKKVGTVATKPSAKAKKGSDLSLFLDMFGPNARKWIVRGVWVLVGLLLAVIVAYQVRASMAAKIAAAEAKLAAAVTVEDFTVIAADHEGTLLGLHAQLAAAEKLYQDGKYKEAAERFARGAAASDGIVSLRAIAGQAHAAEALAAQGDEPDKELLDEAIQLFAKAGVRAGTIGLPGAQVDALLGQSRCERLKGNVEKAREFAEAAKKLAESPEHRILAYSLMPRIEGALRALDTETVAVPAPAKQEEPTEEKPAE